MKINMTRLFGLRKDLHLGGRWWHRLAIVIFSLTLLSTLAISFNTAVYELPSTKFNSTVITSLRDYTKNSKADNAVKGFLSLKGDLGCDKTDKYVFVSDYTLSDKAICNADMIGNISTVANIVHSRPEANKYSVTDIQEGLLKTFQADQEKRYCMIQQSVECTSDLIIKYKANPIYYLESAAISLTITIIFGLLLSMFYYRGLIYVAFGKEGDKK